MTDHTIDRINKLYEGPHGPVRGTDLERHLKAAVHRMQLFEKLHEAVRKSIVENGSDSVTKEVLDVMAETGWDPGYITTDISAA